MPSEARLHPASILFGLIAQLREFAVPLLLALVAGSQRGNFDTIAWIVLIPYTALAVARYFWFTYRFDPHELVIRSGILVRNERHVPYARIQNLDAVQNILHRALGVVEARIDTGSGAEVDATLSVVTWAAYTEMRQRVFAGREAAGVEPGVEPQAERSRTLLRLPARELAIYGLIENRASIVIAGLMGLLWEAGVVESVLERYIGEAAAEGGFLRELVRGAAGSGLGWRRYAVAALALVALLAVLRLLSVGLALVRLRGFRVARVGEDLRAEYGLLTHVTATIPLRRIQTLTMTEGVLHRLFRRTSIRVDTAGGTGRERGGRRRESLAPVIRHARSAAVVREVLPELDLSAVNWQRAAPGAFARELRRRLLFWAVVAGAAGYVWQWRALVLFAVFAAWSLLAASRTIAHLGWAVVDGAVLFKSGWLVRHMTIARFTRVQSVGMWQSPFDRRWAMARVGVDTAGAGAGSHRVHIPYLPLGVASRLHADLSAAAARTAFHW
jgi:putative membrane protein